MSRRRVARIVSPLILFFLRLHTKITGQQRARVLVQDFSGNIMLIWETIGMNRWSIPGGGINKGEEPVAAAARELYEETGIELSPDAFEFVAFIENSVTHVGYDAYLYTTMVTTGQLPVYRPNSLEIVEIKWFPADHLPSPLSPLVRAGLDRLSKTSKI